MQSFKVVTVGPNFFQGFFPSENEKGENPKNIHFFSCKIRKRKPKKR